MKYIKFLLIMICLILAFVLINFAERGLPGKPIYFQTEKDTRIGGPFEGSNSTSRYALTESIAEDKTFLLNRNLAKFASPDVVDYKGKFLSIFTPGVSLLAVPFYILGKYFGIQQLMSYEIVGLFAVINVFLIAMLAKKLGSHFLTGLICGLIFLFATNGLTYALTMTQHHISVTLILLAILNSLRKRTLVNNLLFGLIFGSSIIVDIPNIFFMLPIGVYILSKHFDIKETFDRFTISFRFVLIAIIIGFLPFIGFFAWYNYLTTGSYTKIGQSIGRTKLFRENQPAHLSAEGVRDTSKKEKDNPYDSSLPFNTRKQLSGMYTLLVSNERSWLFYSPVVLIGVFGLIYSYRRKRNIALINLIISICLLDIILYSMFGDPWGGWAFGPRYLIPAAALLCVSLSIILERFRRNIFFNLFFVLILVYSIYINSLGALTTAAIPPKVEAINLPEPIPYTYQYNLQFIQKNISSSLFYNLYFKNFITAQEYLFAYVFVVSLLIGIPYVVLVLKKRRINNHEF